MFKEERETSKFDWSMIGDVAAGRPNLGDTMDVSVYRLMQFTLRDVIIQEFDTATADRLYYKAGELAGREFCHKFISKENDFSDSALKSLAVIAKTLSISIMEDDG